MPAIEKRHATRIRDGVEDDRQIAGFCVATCDTGDSAVGVRDELVCAVDVTLYKANGDVRIVADDPDQAAGKF